MRQRVQFLVLSSVDCRKVLARNRVGRLAFQHEGSVDIEPISYVASGDWVFFRSAYGTKLEALGQNPFAAFEVDEVRGPADWASVVARGTIYMLPADGAPIEQREFAKAVAALRRAMPEAMTPDDPTPARDTVYGLHVDRMTGRMAQPVGKKRGGRKPQPVRKAPRTRRPSAGF